MKILADKGEGGCKKHSDVLFLDLNIINLDGIVEFLRILSLVDFDLAHTDFGAKKNSTFCVRNKF